MTDEKKATPSPAEPRTAKAALAEGDLRSASPASPETILVKTGVDVFTGDAVMKERPAPKVPRAYNDGSRAPYVAHTAVTGSLLGRKFDLRAGEAVNLNADEAKLLAPYVTRAQR